MARRFLLIAYLCSLGGVLQAQEQDPLMKRYLDALGGSEAINAVENVRFTGFLHLQTGRSIPFMLFYARPQMSRLVLQFPEWQQVELTRFGEAWQFTLSAQEPEIRQLEGAEATVQLAEAFPLGSLVAYLQKRYVPQSIMVESGAGGDTIVRLAHGDGVFTEHRLDTAGDIEQITVVTVYPEKFPDRFDVIPSHYEEVAGVRWPMELENRLNGEALSRLEIIDVAVNLPLPPATFALPSETP